MAYDIAKKIATALTGQKVIEIHSQALKYFINNPNSTPKEFCEIANISPKSYMVEANKMKNLSHRLKQAGLDPNKL